MSRSKSNRKYDLEDRIFNYVIDVLTYLKKLPETNTNKIIINQCARSVTSIGANYEEADVAHTKKDFIYKMELVRKETKETRYWIKVANETNSSNQSKQSGTLREEGLELVKIFSTIIKNTKNK